MAPTRSGGGRDAWSRWHRGGGGGGGPDGGGGGGGGGGPDGGDDDHAEHFEFSDFTQDRPNAGRKPLTKYNKSPFDTKAATLELPRFGLTGSRFFRGIPWKSVAASEKMVLKLSRAGVGAKIGSSPAFRISRATRRQRMFGASSSPLFVSIQRTEIGAFPVRANASLLGTFVHTLFS